MTINDILNGKKSAPQFYSQLRGTTLEAASAEPLKLKALRKSGVGLPPKQALPSGLIVSYAGALCYYCLVDLLSKYTQRVKPDDKALEYMAGQMISRYIGWSVLDLPTFVDMCVGSRIPSLGTNGQMEYKLITLDIPNIMDKVEAYDKMRPGKIVSQRMITPTCREREWDSKKEHKLFDGTPYEHGGTEKAQRYWKAMPDYDNPSEKATVQSIIASKQGVGKKVS